MLLGFIPNLIVFHTSKISGIINLFVNGSVNLLAAIACSLSKIKIFGIPSPKATRGSSIECLVIAISISSLLINLDRSYALFVLDNSFSYLLFF